MPAEHLDGVRVAAAGLGQQLGGGPAHGSAGCRGGAGQGETGVGGGEQAEVEPLRPLEVGDAARRLAHCGQAGGDEQDGPLQGCARLQGGGERGQVGPAGSLQLVDGDQEPGVAFEGLLGARGQGARQRVRGGNRDRGEL